VATADLMLDAAARYARSGGSLIRFPGPASPHGARVDDFEGFARTFLLASLRLAGDPGARPDLAALLAAGLTSGPPGAGAPRGGSWPSVRGHSQVVVDTGGLALALWLSRSAVWDRLDDSTQQRLADYLQTTVGVRVPDGNWVLFPMVVSAFLSAVGRDTPAGRSARQRADTALDAWYSGRGWYSDGPNSAFDYYNAWALHFYPVLVAHLEGGGDPVPAARLGAFLRTYPELFASNGAPVFYGRSLTYRFAATAPLWLGALVGTTPLPPARTRRIGSDCLGYFLRGGALVDGVPSLGWLGPDRGAVQRYSSAASPMWAGKAFVALLLGADHPVWTTAEVAGHDLGADRVTPIHGTGLLVQATSGDGIVRLHNNGLNPRRPSAMLRVADDPLYTRVAYSSHTTPVLGPVSDCAAALVLRRGTTQRGPVSRAGEGENWGAATWVPLRPPGRLPRPGRPDLSRLWRPRPGRPLRGVRMTHLALVHGSTELHVVWVRGAPAGTRLRVTGWAAPVPASGAPLTSELLPLIGLTAVEPPPVGARRGRTATVVPTAEGDGVRVNDVLVAVYTVRLSGRPEGPLSDAVAAIEAQGDVVVTWAGGQSQRARLDAGGQVQVDTTDIDGDALLTGGR